MGCDIHAHAEKKINGKWEHLTEIKIPRNYDLFCVMVSNHPRKEDNDYAKGISINRGIPDDINIVTNLSLDDENYHTHSYIFGNEMNSLRDKFGFDGYTFLDTYSYPLIKDDDDFGDDFRLVFAFDC